MNNPVRIVIVDDHTLVRSGFRLLLESIDGFDVVADATNGEEALELIEKATPDIVITDIAMGGMSGIELTAEVLKRWPTTQCIVLSMYKTAPYVKSALAAGASGYLLKESVDAELELAIRSVVKGETYLSPVVADLLVAKKDYALTRRQTEVLRAIAEGMTTKETARHLGVSPKTVETHRAELMKRLDIYDIAGLVRFALREGLTQLD